MNLNENINLCEILKGHEGETFYSPAYGQVCLSKVIQGGPIIVSASEYSSISMNPNGTLLFSAGECMIFPSKSQRDWNKWDKENNLKVPKTWNNITECNVEVWQYISRMNYGLVEPIVKSALALLKIHQLIEVGYGGNVTNEEWENAFELKYVISCTADKSFPIHATNCIHTIAFHTEEQAKEFLKYTENVQLLKDYFMI